MGRGARQGCRARAAEAPERFDRTAASGASVAEAPPDPWDRAPRRSACKAPCSPRSEDGGEEVRPGVQQRCDGQPDDVEVVARDALDEDRAATLDGVAARPS